MYLIQIGCDARTISNSVASVLADAVGLYCIGVDGDPEKKPLVFTAGCDVVRSRDHGGVPVILTMRLADGERAGCLPADLVGRMKLYIHGNCQGTALRRMVDDLGVAIRVRSREVHVLDIPNEIEAYVRDIAEADVILTQPIGDRYRDEPRLSLSWIEANKRPDATVVRFLPLYTRCYLPSQGYLAPVDALAMPYHDYHVVDHYLRGTPVGAMLAELDDPDFYSRDFLEGELALDLEEASRRERDNGIHIRLTRFTADAYRERLLFHTINHPSRLLLARLLNELFVLLGFPAAVPEAGPDYLSGIRTSPYRSIAHHLRFAPALFDDGVEAADRRWRRTDYVAEQLRFYDRGPGRARLESAVAASAVATAYLQRFHASHH